MLPLSVASHICPNLCHSPRQFAPQPTERSCAARPPPTVTIPLTTLRSMMTPMEAAGGIFSAPLWVMPKQSRLSTRVLAEAIRSSALRLLFPITPDGLKPVKRVQTPAFHRSLTTAQQSEGPHNLQDLLSKIADNIELTGHLIRLLYLHRRFSSPQMAER